MQFKYSNSKQHIMSFFTDCSEILILDKKSNEGERYLETVKPVISTDPYITFHYYY